MSASAVATNAAAEVPSATPSPPPRPMRRWRVWLVYAMLLAIVGGHLVEVVTQREHWPFSPYQMWSKPSTSWTLAHEELRAVTDEPQPREIDFYDPSYLYPLPSRFVNLHLLDAAKEARKGNVARQAAVAKNTLDHYNARRKSGQHNGPPIKAIRLYRYEWTINKDASNAARPDRVTLLYDSADPSVAKAQEKATQGKEAGHVEND